jgi:hypothetical protein
MYRIKNWDKFQHYKTGRGAPPWIKLYRDLLNDREWFSLAPEAAKFLISCWLLAAENDGCLPDIDTLAFRLRLASKETVKLLSICNSWIINDDSTLLAKRYQVATPETEIETETEKRKNIARGSRLPPDWTPEGDYDREELERFRDYWIAKAGKDGVKLDWQATWRNWLRNSKQWKPTQPIAKPRTETAQSTDDPFPEHGTIRYSSWDGKVRALGLGLDPDWIADQFRPWAKAKGIAFDGPDIGKAFMGFARAQKRT